jgi:EpsI family protein
LIFSAVLLGLGGAAWEVRPQAGATIVDREPFVVFSARLGAWKGDIPEALAPDVAASLQADDYLSVQFATPTEAAPVQLFIAWYQDQTKGGTHSPEICLPGAGWEIAKLDRIDIAPRMGFAESYNLNRAVIQRGQTRMLVYYWFEQHGRHTAWDFAAKIYLLWDSITIGRTDGALVRLTTPILADETEADAEARLQDMFRETADVLPRFVPGLAG